jgi:hypothetical protein
LACNHQKQVDGSPCVYQFYSLAEVVEPRDRGIWVTNGRVAWWIPDRRFAAWLERRIILCPEGWYVTESVNGSYDPLLVGAMVRCVQEAEWRQVE